MQTRRAGTSVLSAQWLVRQAIASLANQNYADARCATGAARGLPRERRRGNLVPD